MAELGYLDYIFLGIILIMSLSGLIKGFGKEFCGFLGLVCATFLASRYAYGIGDWLGSKLSNFGSEGLRTLLGFVTVFLLTIVVFTIIAKLFSRITAAVLPNYLNKLLGILFGGLKGFLALSFIVFLLSNLNFSQNLQDASKNLQAHITNNSKLYDTMVKIASNIIDFKHMNIQEIKEESTSIVNKVKSETTNTADTLKETIQNSPTSAPQPTPQEGQ